MENADSVVVATASEKTATLFFPKVVPLNYWNLAESVQEEKEWEAFSKLLPDLLPSSIGSTSEIDLLLGLTDLTRNHISNTIENIAPKLATAKGKHSPYDSFEDVLIDLDLDKINQAKYFWEMSPAFAEHFIAKIKPSISGIVGLLPPSGMALNKQESISCMISGISVIDVEKTTWDHVLDVRSDPQAMRRLRKFRLFWHDNFEGKDPEYIKDSFVEMTVQHAETLKSLGMPTRDSYYECVASTAVLSGAVHALMGCFPIDYAALGIGLERVAKFNLSWTGICIDFKCTSHDLT